MKKFILLAVSVVLVLFLVSITTFADYSGEADALPDVWCYVPTKMVESTIAEGAIHYKIRDDGYWTGRIQIADGLPSKEFGFTVVYPSGRVVWSGTIFFPKVTIDGRTGRLWMRAFSTIESRETDWRGTWVITQGTGELAGIQGHGTAVGPGWTDASPYDCGNGYSGGKAVYAVEDLVFPDE